MRGLSEHFTAPRLVWMLTVLQGVLADLPRSSNRRTDAELCLLRLCDERLDESVQALSARLDRVEQQLANGVPAAAMTSNITLQNNTDRKPENSLQANEGQGETPVEKKRADPVPTEPKRPPEPRRQAADVPENVPSTPGSAADDGSFWRTLAPALKDKVPRNAWSFLGNAGMVQGSLESGVLTLWVDDELVKGVVSRPAVLETIRTLAQARLGGPVRVQAKVGKAPAGGAEAAHDNLDDLLAMGQRFDNITIKE